ncbi:Os11g0637000 [Oryza sativa Japonica Group]|uniref:Os11g0637000 protein n=1 Tax=Oryza sativa subsp. japonica TaxID=39947 RepID=A0A0P0Y4M3_ORYSJ|nr:Os11g0637000 [Oryza sativa Japonica Group]
MAHDGAAAAATLLASSGDNDDKPRRRRNMYAFGCATLASMTTILMGYNLALMSGGQLFVREDMALRDAEIEVLTGSMNVFMLVSILAAGWAADVLGRRGTLVLANAFLMAGALAMSLGATYAALMAARFVTSVGVGFSLVVAPVYNAEISPASARGVVSTLFEMFVNVGILLGYVSNYALSGLPACTSAGASCSASARSLQCSSPRACSPCRSRRAGSPCAVATPTRARCSCAPPTPSRRPSSASRRSSTPPRRHRRRMAAACGGSCSCGRRRWSAGSSRAWSAYSSSSKRRASTWSCSTARWCSRRPAWRRTPPSWAPPSPSGSPRRAPSSSPRSSPTASAAARSCWPARAAWPSP